MNASRTAQARECPNASVTGVTLSPYQVIKRHFHCLSLTFHCLSLTVHCLSLTFHCLSLTFH